MTGVESLCDARPCAALRLSITKCHQSIGHILPTPIRPRDLRKAPNPLSTAPKWWSLLQGKTNQSSLPFWKKKKKKKKKIIAYNNYSWDTPGVQTSRSARSTLPNFRGAIWFLSSGLHFCFFFCRVLKFGHQLHVNWFYDYNFFLGTFAFLTGRSFLIGFLPRLLPFSGSRSEPSSSDSSLSFLDLLYFSLFF
jgi:hypothetical protein